jgi:hypothetical protein
MPSVSKKDDLIVVSYFIKENQFMLQPATYLAVRNMSRVNAARFLVMSYNLDAIEARRIVDTVHEASDILETA